MHKQVACFHCKTLLRWYNEFQNNFILSKSLNAVLFIIAVTNLASDFKSTGLNCAPAPQPSSSTQFSQIRKESGCIWYYRGWRTGNGSNSKGFKCHQNELKQEIKRLHSSPLVLQCGMITCKSHQYSYKNLREKRTQGRPLLLFAHSYKGKKQQFALTGHRHFWNQDKLSLVPE